MGDRDEVVESELIDLSGLSLRELRSLDGRVLGDAVRRVRAEADNPRGAAAGFQSNVLPGPAGR